MKVNKFLIAMLAEMNLSLLKKIEELTLYTIELNKRISI